jgi:hypothetical protein
MNKKTILGIAVIALTAIVAVTGCSKKDGTSADSGSRTVKYNPESDFNVWVIDGGISIIGYNGDKKEVNIPPIIQDLPVTRIGQTAFYELQLTSVTIPDSVRLIGNQAFARNQLTSFTIPDSVTEIGVSAFSGNQLTSITIPNGITLINQYAFHKNQLTNVAIPDSVFIGTQAFDGNPLISVTIGANVYVEGLVFAVGFPVEPYTTVKEAVTYTRPDTNKNSAWTKQ